MVEVLFDAMSRGVRMITVFTLYRYRSDDDGQKFSK